MCFYNLCVFRYHPSKVFQYCQKDTYSRKALGRRQRSTRYVHLSLSVQFNMALIIYQAMYYFSTYFPYSFMLPVFTAVFVCLFFLNSDVCHPLVVNPVQCHVGKPPSLFNTLPPGHLFTQTKTEPTPSNNGDGWKFFSNVTVQPSSAPDPSIAHDFRTVNLSDLHDFSYPNFPSSAPDQSDTSRRGDGTGANGAGTTAAQEVQNTFPSFENEILDFPSFSEAQTSDVDNINNDEFQALFSQSGLPGEGPSTASVCHANAVGNTANDSASGSNGAEQAARNGTWMNFPPSIINFLQNEQMPDSGMPATTATPVQHILDETDMLNSLDEDRLMSILNNGNQVSFLSGHPT